MVGQVVPLGELRHPAVALEERERRHRLEDRGPHGVVVDRAGHDGDERLARGELGRGHLLDVQRAARVLVAGRHPGEHLDLVLVHRRGPVRLPGPRSRRRSRCCGPRRGWPRGSGPCGRAPSAVRACSIGGGDTCPANLVAPPALRSAPYDGPHDVIRLTGAGDAAQARGIQCRRVPRLRPAPPAGARRGRRGDLRGAGVVEHRVPHPARRGAAVQRDGRVPVARRGASSCRPATRTPWCPAPACSPVAAADARCSSRTSRRGSRAPRPGCATALDGGDDVLRSALLDLRALSVGLPVSVAGWSDRWRYAWPRDVSFVATALARIGHPEHAAEQLAFLQEVQRAGRGVRGALRPEHPAHARRAGGPARRLGLGRVGRAPARAGRPRPRRRAADPAAVDARAQRDPADVRRSTPARTCRRPRPTTGSSSSASVTLGTAASVLAGLRSATEVLPLVGEPVLAEQDPGRGRVAVGRRARPVRRRGVPAPARRLRRPTPR